MDNLPPEAWTEVGKLGPIGIFALIVLVLMRDQIVALFTARKDKGEPGIAEVIAMITDWRVEMRDEFKAVRKEIKDVADKESGLRDRISHMEGRMG